MNSLSNLSAIIPVKNGEAFVGDSFKRILKNFRETDEIIYIDDHSTDNTTSLLYNLSKSHKNVRIVKNPRNGIVDAMNYGISKSKNKWIARFDIDDFYSLDRIEIQRKFIFDQVAAIFCDYDFIDQNGCEMGQVLSPIFGSATIGSLILCQRTPHPGVIFSKDAYSRAGGYKECDFPAEDIALWLRISRFGKVISIPKKLLKYRIHPYSITATKREQVNFKRQQVIDEYFPKKQILNMFNFRNDYRKYKLVDNSHERQFLAFRDYLAFLRHSNLRGRIALHLLYYGPKIIFNPKKLRVLFRLFKEKITRNKYRSKYYKFE